tara:strand:- start:154 stop:516 length:363 start_codon:yes stop_codon:yes gene_type:complete
MVTNIDNLFIGSTYESTKTNKNSRRSITNQCYFNCIKSAEEENSNQNTTNKLQGNIKTSQPELIKGFERRLNIYKEVTLAADLSHLSTNQKKRLALLIDTSKIIDDFFWQQAYTQNKKVF